MATEEGNTKESVLLGWKANEFELYERSLVYYILIALLLVAIIGYSIYTQDWYAIPIFLILAGFFVWYQRKIPAEKTYRITQLGLYEDNKFYQYNEIFSYWFVLDGEYKALNIIFAKKYLPQLTILLAGTDPVKIRATLSKYIPEESHRRENILDRLVRLFRL
jgi:hypothetical protein